MAVVSMARVTKIFTNYAPIPGLKITVVFPGGRDFPSMDKRA